MGRGGNAGGWVTAGQVGVAASERDGRVIARRGGADGGNRGAEDDGGSQK